MVKVTLIVVKENLSNGLYSLIGPTVIGGGAFVSIEDTSLATEHTFVWTIDNNILTFRTDKMDLLHKRLDHVRVKNLDVLYKSGLFGKDKLGNFQFCRKFVYGKSHRVKFNMAVHTTRRIMDYCHANLWGASRFQLHGDKTSKKLQLTD